MAIIAISRGTLGGGEALAHTVAERLGYRCVSRELLLEAARQYNVSMDELCAVVDQPPSFSERVTAPRRTLLFAVQAALCEAAESGDLVYHGHIGHLLLPGISHLLRVRVIAEPGTRLRLSRVQYPTRAAGLKHLARVDEQRRTWVRFLFGVEWDDPLLYDVVVNLTRMDIDTAADVVAALAGRPDFQPTAASQAALADLTIQARISAQLATDPRTAAGLTFHVSVQAGIATITIGEAEQRDAVRMIAARSAGVRDVRVVVRGLSQPYSLAAP